MLAISTAHNLAAGCAMLGIFVFFWGAFGQFPKTILFSFALFALAVILASA